MNSALDIIRREIAKGSISFARFMELALYAPDAGYYERPRDIGRRGDFFTSVSVGKLFGELLAFQFAEWTAQSPMADGGLRIVEAGAHDGRLAADVLEAMRKNHPHIFRNTDYCLLEPSATRRAWQKKTLHAFSEQVHWADNPQSAPGNPKFTIVFSNELFDAMPAHRIRWNANQKTWQEMKVALDDSGFVWTSENISPELERYLPAIPELLQKILPDGFTTEISPAAINWWKEAAAALPHGKLLAIDYGMTNEEFFMPHRASGTLRAYFHHSLSADLLANPGEQDLTAHVNFSTLQKIGEDAGLRTIALTSQRRFLTEIAAQMWKSPEQFAWDKDRSRQFQTLTHEDHLGRAFRLLLQERT